MAGSGESQAIDVAVDRFRSALADPSQRESANAPQRYSGSEEPLQRFWVMRHTS